MLRRRRFAEVISRQLDLFAREQGELIERCAEAERRYDEAARDEAEERYGDYVDLLGQGTEALAELRDGFASSLEEGAAEDYVAAFNRAVTKRLPRFALELGER